MSRILLVFQPPLIEDLSLMVRALKDRHSLAIAASDDVSENHREFLKQLKARVVFFQSPDGGIRIRNPKQREDVRLPDIRRINGRTAMQAGWPILLSKMNRARSFIDGFLSQYAKFRPHLVFAFHETSVFGRCAILSAQSRGIPTIVLQHAQIRHAFYTDTPAYADMTCVMGEWSRSQLQRAGVNSARIAVTGQPRFDKLPALRLPTRKLRTKYSIPRGLKVLTCTTSHIVGRRFTKLIAQCIVTFARAAPDYFCIVKLHQHDPFEEIFQDAISRSGCENRIRVMRSANVHELFHISRAVSSSGGTTDLEAMLMSKPVLRFGFVKSKRDWDAVEKGAAVPVETVNSFTSRMRRIETLTESRRHNAAVAAYLDEQCHLRDRRSTKRVVEVVEGMLNP